MSGARRLGQGVEDGRLERQMVDFRADTERAKRAHDRRQLRNHQIVDAPVLAARRFDPTWPIRIGLPMLLDAPHETGVDMEDVLIDDQIGPEVLDLGEQDFFGLRIEPGAESDLAGQRPQHRLERV